MAVIHHDSESAMLAALATRRPSLARREEYRLSAAAVNDYARVHNLTDIGAATKRLAAPHADAARSPRPAPTRTAGADARLLDAARRRVAESGGRLELRDATCSFTLTETAEYRESFNCGPR